MVGVSQPCSKVLLGGFPPESWEMGPELGPRLQAPITEGLVSGPWPRAALPGKKSRGTNEQNVPFRTTLGTRQRSSKYCPEGLFGPLDALHLGHLPRALRFVYTTLL